MTLEEIDPDELDTLVAQEIATKPRKTKNDKLDHDDRTVTNWFKFQHTYGTCENPDCNDPRPSTNPKFKTAMLSVINGKKICRFCFIEGYNVTTE